MTWLHSSRIYRKPEQMRVFLLNLKEQYRSLKKEVLAVTEMVYESQHFHLEECAVSL